MSRFPLAKVTRAQRQSLAKVLWSWRICSDCSGDKPCEPPICSWHRSESLEPFFDFYEEETCSYRCDIKADQSPPICCHEDLFNIIRELKSKPDSKRSEIVESLYPDRPVGIDQERAVDLAIRIMFMINSSVTRHDSILVEAGSYQFPWRDNVTLAEFVESLFKHRPGSNFGRIDDNLRAVKLKKLASLRFESTDDMRCHLKFDRRRAVVQIFHHAAFLKEQLRLTIDKPSDLSISQSIELGALPRALVLEVLNSTQRLLFPLTDSKSKALLKSLTSTEDFDEDMLRYEFNTICNPDEKEPIYQYFTAELEELYEEQLHPTLKGAQKWFERRSGARYVMMVTVAGITFAFLTLGLGIFQSWVAWQQWQDPKDGRGS